VHFTGEDEVAFTRSVPLATGQDGAAGSSRSSAVHGSMLVEPKLALARVLEVFSRLIVLAWWPTRQIPSPKQWRLRSGLFSTAQGAIEHQRSACLFFHPASAGASGRGQLSKVSGGPIRAGARRSARSGCGLRPLHHRARAQRQPPRRDAGRTSLPPPRTARFFLSTARLNTTGLTIVGFRPGRRRRQAR